MFFVGILTFVAIFAFIRWDIQTNWSNSSVYGAEIVEEVTETVEKANGITELGEFEITGYCACERCCDQYADGITATGTEVHAGRTIAVDPTVIPYGTTVLIKFADGLWHPFIAEDCGGAIKGNHIDIYFDTHEEALQFGRQILEVALN